MKKFLTALTLTLAVSVTSADVSTYKDALKQAQTSDAAKDFISARKSLGIALATATTPAEKARVLIAMGRVYSDEANYPKAREAWQQVTDSEGSTDAEKWGGLALIGGSYLTEKNYPEARRVLSQVIANPLVPTTARATKLARRRSIKNSCRGPISILKCGQTLKNISLYPKPEIKPDKHKRPKLCFGLLCLCFIATSYKYDFACVENNSA